MKIDTRLSLAFFLQVKKAEGPGDEAAFNIRCLLRGKAGGLGYYISCYTSPYTTKPFILKCNSTRVFSSPVQFWAGIAECRTLGQAGECKDLVRPMPSLVVSIVSIQ